MYEIENLKLAHKNARKGKLYYDEVKMVDADPDKYLESIRQSLINKTFKNSEYEVFKKICGTKEREIYKLPYYPDRIVQHAIMQVLGPIWMKIFIHDTYASLKGRGIHSAVKSVRKALKDKDATKYCLKLDIKKFYPSIDNDIIKQVMRRKLKDKDLLGLLDHIIDSAKGVPIGNYVSQYLANLYLAYFDHWIKEDCGVSHYFRYCDDIVILHADKMFLHELLEKIRQYLKDNLKLEVKDNYQVFPVESRGIDFVGYRFFHGYALLRKSIKLAMINKLSKGNNKETAAAYYGWMVHADCTRLRNKYIKVYEKQFKHAS